jgi:hypothetical protein
LQSFEPKLLKLKIKDIQKSVSDETKIWASKGIVRECDEEIKGQFVSYVDIGDSSFDVSINLSPKNDILNYTCDCQINGTICMHVLALANFILSKGKVDVKVPRKRKLSEIELLLESIDRVEIITWIKDTFKNNKDLELSFKLKFTDTEKTQIDIKTVLEQMNTAKRSVVKNKKNISSQELKKIIDLWQVIHEPFLDNLHQNLTKKDTAKDLKKIFNALEEYYFGFNTSSTRIEGYLKRIIANYANAITSLPNSDDVKIVLGQSLIDFSSKSEMRVELIILATELLKSKEKKYSEVILAEFLSHYQELFKNLTWAESEYTYLLAETIIKLNLSEEHFAKLKPVRYANEFNLELINFLVKKKEYTLAEKYALEQIKVNYYEEYNVPYNSILKGIYYKNNETEKLLQLN